MATLFLTAIFFIILIVTGGIVTASLYAQKDIGKVNDKIADQNKLLLRYKEPEDKIKNINSKLSQIESAKASKIIWSDILVELSKDTPSQVQIKTLSLNQTNNKVDLTGYAETRSDIAQFKEKLESSKYFKNVTFSSSIHNEQQANFSYNISCELKEAK